MNKKTYQMVQAGVIAAMYIVLLLVFKDISSGPIQIRVAEALSILPFFTPAAVPGLFIGCLLGNFFVGAPLWDVLLGSLISLLAAYVARKLRFSQWLVPLPAIIFNAVGVALILKYVYAFQEAYIYLLVTVMAGQIVAVYGLGMLLLVGLKPFRQRIFGE